LRATCHLSLNGCSIIRTIPDRLKSVFLRGIETRLQRIELRGTGDQPHRWNETA